MRPMTAQDSRGRRLDNDSSGAISDYRLTHASPDDLEVNLGINREYLDFAIPVSLDISLPLIYLKSTQLSTWARRYGV